MLQPPYHAITFSLWSLTTASHLVRPQISVTADLYALELYKTSCWVYHFGTKVDVNNEKIASECPSCVM